MNTQLRTKENSPIYLFRKLGRCIAISTVTGDFYSLTSETYVALGKWSEELLKLKTPPSLETSRKFANEHNIPQDIFELFPLPQKSKIVQGDKDATAHITDLTINLTSQCNLRCLYCWNDQGKYSDAEFQQAQCNTSKEDDQENEMSIETACRSVDMLVELCGEDRNLVVDFYGGEPLMNLETLFATVDYCKKNESKWNVSFYFLLATNGTLLTPALAKNLIDKGVQIAISLDGPKPVQDNNRPFANGNGSFDTIASNLGKMPEKLLTRLVGRTTVTPFYTDMVSLYGNLKNLGFERIELFESEDACHKINPQRESVFFHTDQQYQQLCKEYERLALLYIDEVIARKLDYRKTFFNRFFKLMQRLYYSHELTGGCPAAQGQLAVAANGDIYPCTAFLGVEKFRFGNVADGIEKGKYNSFIKDINRRFDCCKDCSLFSLCRTTGSCLNMNHYFNGDIAKPYDKSCELFSEKLELAIASLDILSEKIPERIEELFGFDPVGKRGNQLY